MQPCIACGVENGHTPNCARERWMPAASKPVQAEAASAHDWHHLDGRIKALMEQVGLPNSLSLRQAFSQLVNEMSVAATSKGTGNG